MTTYNSIVHHGGRIHGEHASHKRSHMDNKIDDGFRIHGEKKMMVIRCDNQGAISLTKNPTHHARTKHIDVQHHFVRKRIENGEVRFEYCPTEHMVADVFTKALSK